MATFIYPSLSIDTTGLATEAKQDVIISELVDVNSELDSQTVLLTSLDGKDYATETTLATKASEATLATRASEATLATRASEVTLASLEAKDFATQTTLASLEAKDFATQTTLASLEAKDFATQTTLAAVLTELQLKADLTETQPVSAVSLPLPTGAATEATLNTVAGDTTSIDSKITTVDTGNVTVSSSALPTGASTAANQTTANASLSAIETDIDQLNARVAGSLVPETHDFVSTTYVAAGNGAGEIETVTYKTGGAAGTTVATLTLAYDGSNRLSSVTRS